MSGIQILQDILIVLLAGYMTIDQNGLVIMSWFPVIVGTITGLIMGDLPTALTIAGTFQLMMLGVAALGVRLRLITDWQQLSVFLLLYELDLGLSQRLLLGYQLDY